MNWEVSNCFGINWILRRSNEVKVNIIGFKQILQTYKMEEDFPLKWLIHILLLLLKITYNQCSHGNFTSLLFNLSGILLFKLHLNPTINVHITRHFSLFDTSWSLSTKIHQDCNLYSNSKWHHFSTGIKFSVSHWKKFCRWDLIITSLMIVIQGEFLWL